MVIFTENNSRLLDNGIKGIGEEQGDSWAEYIHHIASPKWENALLARKPYQTVDSSFEKRKA